MSSGRTENEVTVLLSALDDTLQSWHRNVRNGHVKLLKDDEVQSTTIEVKAENVSTCYLMSPASHGQNLNIKHPFLCLVVKNLEEDFLFDVHVLDDTNSKRRFRASTLQCVTKVQPFICTMPLKLDKGWNLISLNLREYTRHAFRHEYKELLGIQIHANCRIRSVYVTSRQLQSEELPAEVQIPASQ
mmetsp:Transcript_75/g.121  ORF Transcript_75/g.121 Transcript_75/m.121 type:complete len:187 (-) Transcript_75:156-716(-)